MTTQNDASQVTSNLAESASPIILLSCEQIPQRKPLADVLQEDGNRVVFSPTAAEGIRRIASGDLLLVVVPEIGENEYSLLDQARNRISVRPTPIFLMADNLSPEAVSEAFAHGADDVVATSEHPSVILARIKAALNRKRSWDAEEQDFGITSRGVEENDLLASSLLALGIIMIREKDPLRIMELILTEGMRITDCEGGSIYMLDQKKQLHFILVRNDMLDINMGGSTGRPITFGPLALYDEKGKPNHKFVANHAALMGQTINIADAYVSERFDFSGTRVFDQKTGYRSKSFLTIPLKNEKQQVIGVMQLINARDRKTGVVTAFDAILQPTIEAFAALTSKAMEVYKETLPVKS